MKTIFWDFDGTLVSSPHLWSGSMLAALKEADPQSEISLQDIQRYTAVIFTWNFPEKDYRQYTREKWWHFMNRRFYESYIDLGVTSQVARRATLLIRSIILKSENYLLFPDTVSTLKAVRETGVRNVILSNNIPELEDIIRNIGLHEYFDGYVVSAIEGYDKPRRELFEIAKKRFPSKKYIMVGDNPNADIKGGNAAHMETVLVHKGFCPQADHCFDNLEDIADAL